MPLVIASVKNQESLGSAATTITEDIRFGYTTNSFHFDVFAYKDSGTAATVQNLVDKITRIKLNTLNGTPESTIDGDDAFDMNPLVYNKMRYHSILTSTDNIPHGFGIQLPMTPYPDQPSRNFGMPAGQGVQWVYDTAADVSQDFDGYTADLTVEGIDSADKPNPLGYVKYMQDSFTSDAVDSEHLTKIGVAKRLLNILNFQTTSFDDLAASAAFDVTGIREQRVKSSSKIVYQYKPERHWSMKKIQTVASFAAGAAVINILDDGRFDVDFGMQNSSDRVGMNITNNPNVEIGTVAGVASEATRVNPIVLV